MIRFIAATEFSGPIQCVKKTNHYVSSDRFFYALEASSATEEFLESARVGDMLKYIKNSGA